MDKILSARVDESTVQRLGYLARMLQKSKKAILEEAISLYAAKVEGDRRSDPLDVAFGAWQREGPPEQTVEEIRERSRKGWRRLQT